MKKKILSIVLIMLMMVGCTMNNEKKELNINWTNITTEKYRSDDNVHYIIAVKYKSNDDAEVVMYEKDYSEKRIWTEILRCEGKVSKNGIDKEKEGDLKTPTGDFGVGKAFGLKENPGTKLDYLDIDEDLYNCGDETAYNQFINIKDFPHDCKGEHMIDYSPHYNYGFEIGYNIENIYGKGSAIFFHCFGPNSYTGGCVAVSEENMKYILTKIDKNTRVIINYSK